MLRFRSKTQIKEKEHSPCLYIVLNSFYFSNNCTDPSCFKPPQNMIPVNGTISIEMKIFPRPNISR